MRASTSLLTVWGFIALAGTNVSFFMTATLAAYLLSGVRCKFGQGEVLSAGSFQMRVQVVCRPAVDTNTHGDVSVVVFCITVYETGLVMAFIEAETCS
jgi:hypothetical protein